MNTHEATQLLDRTFNNAFDIDQVSRFVKEVFNTIDIQYVEKTQYIANQYKDYISEVMKIGSYAKDNKKLEVLTIKLKKSSSRDRARTMQRNFIANWLNKMNIDAALVAFYGEEPEDWRFSFVKMEYNLVRDKEGKVEIAKELTPAKRYSYLVGVNEPNHTCRSQFLNLVRDEDIQPSLSDIENAFSIEKITKEFFEKYKELVHDLGESIEKVVAKDRRIQKEFEKCDIDAIDFSKKLLGQIVFLYFLQKKGWLGIGKDKNGEFGEWGTGPKNFLRQLYEGKYSSYDNFFNDVLEHLFYDALARPRDNDYYGRFNCKIPFLNGGLFEPINDYDWTSTDILIDNKIFEKILGTFDVFNFTVKEDEPLEKEVAVDPEMLGKVFENLLGVKERKDKGAFYTPREIVHYICQQSLINYLETNTSVSRGDIEKFIHLGDLTLANDQRILIDLKSKRKKLALGIISPTIFEKEFNQLLDSFSLPRSIIEKKEIIDRLLHEIKIVDPAVGSGAFPMGMMNEIVKARNVLTIFFDPDEQVERNIYKLKRECIENSLYGVDIDPSAVEIAKLRFWLALIVDEEKKENIKPLPNLDHKIMCGNSLLEKFEGIKLFDDGLLNIAETKSTQQYEIEEIKKQLETLYKLKGKIVIGQEKNENLQDVENNISILERKRKRLLKPKTDKKSRTTLEEALQQRKRESQKKLKELRKLHKIYFNEQNRDKKKALKENIDNLEWELIETTLEEQGHPEALQKLERYKKSQSKPFFLWKLQFAEIFQRENPGFDVVIANPPYVSAWTMEKEDPTMRTQIINSLMNYSIFKNHWDLYIAFVAQGHNILRSLGSLSFIVPNPILREKYAIETRKFLLQNMKLQSILEFNDVNVFEGVSRRTSVFVVKNIVDAQYSVGIFSNKMSENGIIEEINRVDHKQWLKSKTAQFLIEGTSDQDELVEKFERLSDRIGNFFYVNYGAQVCSKDKGAFKKKDVVNQKNIFNNGKEFYEGKDVHRWTIAYRGLWLDYRPNEMYGPRASKLFESNKIVIRHVSDKHHRLAVAFDESNRYCDHGIVIVVPYSSIENTTLQCEFKGYKKINGKVDLKYALAFLLSNVETYHYRKRFSTESLQGSTSHVYPTSARGLIFKYISYDKQLPFIELVDKISSITRDDDYSDSPDMQKEVNKLEKEVDILIYKLYDLTPEEIRIVEQFNQN